ncbi:MAG: competence protein ComEA [Actinomycetota bacterium]|jgi:competence protein ComEA
MQGLGDWRDRLPLSAVAAVVVVVIVAVVAVTALMSGRAGSWSAGGGGDVALSLPKADGSAAGSGGGGSRGASAGGDAGPTTSTTGDGPLHVHAAGAVMNPGVVQVPPGSRVTDMVAAAGGPAPDADLNQVNLAALVTDGERVYIPHKGEVGAGLVAAGGSSDGAAAADAIVNLNDADQTQLESLPGVGPATAKAIVDYRNEHGRFRSVDDLLNVHGIGPAKLEQIKPHARV